MNAFAHVGETKGHSATAALEGTSLREQWPVRLSGHVLHTTLYSREQLVRASITG